jgi:HD superfamily phosphohydrolase
VSQFVAIIKNQDHNLETIWGERVTDPSSIVLEVIQSPIMERLKDVDQSGPPRYFGPRLPGFSRFEHCIGVWIIAKKAKAGIKEQIASLLHDVSHIVFSHVSNYLFIINSNNSINKYVKRSYQEMSHISYLQRTNILQLIGKHGFTIADLDVTNVSYTSFNSRGIIGADIIHYNVHTAVLFGIFSKSEAREIINGLKFENEKWFFLSRDLAKKFAEASVYLTKNFWGAKWNTSMNIHLAMALERALKIKLIKYGDLYSTDTIIMNRLVKNQDRVIQMFLQQCRQPVDRILGQRYTTERFTPKFCGVDPYVFESGKLKKLSELDSAFKKYHDDVRDWCEVGYDVEVLQMPNYTKSQK